MKKGIACLLCLCLLMGLSACVPTEPAALKLGLGMDLAFAAKETGGTIETTWAAVLIGSDGRIVDCRVDAVTTDFVPGEETALTTKNTLKEAYGMVAYGGAEKEWYEQVEIFCEAVRGRTLEQAMNLQPGSEADLTAGCTISLLPMQYALAKAYMNAMEVSASAEDALRFSLNGSILPGEETDGYEFQAVAVTMSGDRVTSCHVDAARATPDWSVSGEQTGYLTKRELGFDYGMVAYANATYEWFEQLDYLQNAVVGLTADEVLALAGENGKIRPDIDLASKATIYVGGILGQIVETMAA